ncbi:MAG: hypothetical protein GYB33_03440 [Gammaproteobacteria bacterium]|nr:hypothetical protein [Gammaproteobacteria bacterium]
MKQHPWALVGPWYRTESSGGGPANKTTAPIFQKYAGTDFIDRLLREPQESLKFVCEDFVDRLCVDPNLVVSPATRSKFDDSLKLFLDVHSRFYLVVCELHCVAPGFPSVSREQVCETGFVIRRRVPQIASALQTDLGKLLQQRNHLKQQLVKMSAATEVGGAGIVAQAQKQAAALTLDGIKAKKTQQLELQLNEKQQQLDQFVQQHKLKLSLQGWQPSSDVEGAWQWRETEQQPQVIEEQVLPLYPLIADPTASGHSASKRTLWYGLVPTASSDVDVDGNLRFDDSDLYEVQCFVRRKKACCAGKGRNCCHGEVVWSKPTTSYRLASYFDLDGGSHRPINIKLPDLAALKNQAALSPPGRGVNGKVIAPAGSGLNFKTSKMDMPTKGSPPVRPDQQICFFAILLFFFVAFFLFRLFLPIVLFIFQLWFLLTLRFCIPPTIGLDAGIAADIKLQGPDIDLAFGADVTAKLEFGGQLFTKAQLQAELTKSIGEGVGSDSGGFAADISNDLASSLSLNELADLYLRMATDFSDSPANPQVAGKIPLPQDGLVYFEKVMAAKAGAL